MCFQKLLKLPESRSDEGNFSNLILLVNNILVNNLILLVNNLILLVNNIRGKIIEFLNA